MYRRTQILILRDYSSLNSLLQILEIFTGNRQSSPRGLGPSYQLRSDVLYKNNKKLFSICPAPLPPGQDHFKQFPTPGLGGGMVTGKIEPCVSSEGDCNLPFFFRPQLTYMYEIKALHCVKCFLLFVTHNGMFMF